MAWVQTTTEWGAMSHRPATTAALSAAVRGAEAVELLAGYLATLTTTGALTPAHSGARLT